MQSRSRLFVFSAWVVATWGVWAARPFLIPLCLAALLAFLMAPVLRGLKRLGVPEGLGVFLSAGLLVLPILAIGYLAVSQAESLVQDWPRISRSLEESLSHWRQSAIAEKLHLTPYLKPANLSSSLSSHAQSGLKFMLSTLREMALAGAEFALVLFFAIVMLASRVHLRKSFERISRRQRTIDQMAVLMEHFLLARIILAVAVGTLDFAVLKAFGFPYSFFLGAFLGLMTWVPAVGFLIGILPPIVLGLSSGLNTTSFVAALLLVGLIQAIQDHFATPKFIGHKLNLNFLATYLALFAGERLWGAWGMFLAIPLLGLARIALSATPELEPWAQLLSETDHPPRRLLPERSSKSSGGRAA